VHTVRIDLYKAGYIATEHLIKKGYKKIGFITGPLNNEWFLPRFEGYLSALRENRIEFNLEFVKELLIDIEKEVIDAFEKILKLKNRPEAIFCANDQRAIWILEYCYKKNIKVPEEMAICGLDNIPESEKTNPPLTTVDTFFEKLGEKAVELGIKIMEKRVNEIQDILIKPEIVERKST